MATHSLKFKPSAVAVFTAVAAVFVLGLLAFAGGEVGATTKRPAAEAVVSAASTGLVAPSVEPNATPLTETVIVVGTQSEAQTINAALSRLAISRVIVDPTVSVVVPARESEVLTVVPDVGSLLATMSIQGQLHVLDLRG